MADGKHIIAGKMELDAYECCKPVVLVVEDEALLRAVAVDGLADAGFEAVEARSADVALDILEHRDDIRAVFTDIQMPGSMDGLALAATIRDRWPPVDIIVTSGVFDRFTAGIPQGALFFPKPYDPAAIVNALHTLIH